MPIIKHLQVIWSEFEDKTINSVAENMVKENFTNEYPDKKTAYTGFDSKCLRIFNSLSQEQKNFGDYLKFVGSAARLYYIMDERIQ